ncbi:MAG: hypothetical protein ACTS5P_02370 [Candidatus Hodgkinia cicadicola]
MGRRSSVGPTKELTDGRREPKLELVNILKFWIWTEYVLLKSKINRMETVCPVREAVRCWSLSRSWLLGKQVSISAEEWCCSKL